jgi:hypothetical protein
MRPIRILCFVFGFAIPLLPVHGNAFASKTLVQVETVQQYTACFGPGWDLANADQSGVNFYTELLRVNSLGFSLHNGRPWQDPDTWNVDYLDPDTVNPWAYSDDYLEADAPNMAISFFQGHGALALSDGMQCTSASDCTHPPLGGGAASCDFSPHTYQAFGTGYGACMYASARALLTCGNGDSSSGPWSPHVAFLTGPNMVLGENPTEGGWRGAGTNGGTSLAIFHISHGLSKWFPNTEWSSLYGGIHLFASILPDWGGDTSDSLAFGNAVASPYSANPHSAVASAYANAITSVYDGGGCPGPGGASGGGINGCGCHVIISYANNRVGASAMLTQSWYSLASDASEYATSTAYYAYLLGCNYDPSTYGWSGSH